MYIIVCLLEARLGITTGQRKGSVEGTISPKTDIQSAKNRNETNEHALSVDHTTVTRNYATEVNTQAIPETETKLDTGPITQEVATKSVNKNRFPAAQPTEFEKSSPSSKSLKGTSLPDQTVMINIVDVGGDALEVTTEIETPFSEATMKELDSVRMSTDMPDKRTNASSEITDGLAVRLSRTQLVLISHFYKIGITVVGLVGNALNLVVLNAPTMRRAPSNIYMSALACSDMVYLLHTVPFSISGCGGQSSEIFREIYGSILVYSVIVLS